MAGGVPAPRPRGRPPGVRNARRGRRREPLVVPDGQVIIIKMKIFLDFKIFTSHLCVKYFSL